MTILSILIALLLERVMPQLLELRRFGWLRDYTTWATDLFSIDKLGAWLGLGLLIAPLLVAGWIAEEIFDNALFGLFELAFGVLIVFFCLGPRDLDRDIDNYLDVLELGDAQQRDTAAARLCADDPASDLSEQVKQVVHGIFSEANIRVFSLLFWFALLGPVMAIAYRVLDLYLRHAMLKATVTGWREQLRLVLGLLDWIPSRISMFAFMLSGSFEDGLMAYRRGQVTAIEVYAQNNEMLGNVGMQSLSVQPIEDPVYQAMDRVRKARGLVLRALVVWLLLLLLISLLD